MASSQSSSQRAAKRKLPLTSVAPVQKRAKGGGGGGGESTARTGHNNDTHHQSRGPAARPTGAPTTKPSTSRVPSAAAFSSTQSPPAAYRGRGSYGYTTPRCTRPTR